MNLKGTLGAGLAGEQPAAANQGGSAEEPGGAAAKGVYLEFGGAIAAKQL